MPPSHLAPKLIHLTQASSLDLPRPLQLLHPAPTTILARLLGSLPDHPFRQLQHRKLSPTTHISRLPNHYPYLPDPSTRSSTPTLPSPPSPPGSPAPVSTSPKTSSTRPTPATPAHVAPSTKKTPKPPSSPSAKAFPHAIPTPGPNSVNEPSSSPPPYAPMASKRAIESRW